MQNKWLNSRPILDPQDTYTLRGICMIMIMVHHLMKYHIGTSYTMHWGDIGIGAFFFISGFGLYSSMSRKYVDMQYFWQNIKKMLIPFFVCWIICLIACIIFFRDYFAIGIGGILRDLFTLTYPMAWPGIWFIKVILVEYVITILSYMLFKNKLLRLLIPTLCTSIYFIIAWKVLRWSPYLYCTTLCFVLGLWLSAYKPNFQLNSITKFIGVIVFLALYMIFKKGYLDFPGPPLAMYAICFSLFAVFAVSLIDIVNPFLHYIGKKSLLFYLIHIPFLDYTMNIIQRDNFNPWYAFGVMFIMTYGMCVLYDVCEEKILQYRKRN